MGIVFSQAIEGYLLDAHARQLAQSTIEGYTRSANRFLNWIDGDPPIDEIEADDIRRFMQHLSTQKTRSRGAVDIKPRPLSKKTIRNIHIALSAIWTWALDEDLVEEHIVRAIKPPKAEKRVIKPYTREEVKAMLDACDKSEAYERPGKKKCRNTRATAERDRAIVLLLLDTGMRASELADNPPRDSIGLRIKDIDLKQRYVKVFGKGDKERIIPISPTTAKAVWRYLASRPEARPDEPLLLGRHGGPLSSSGVGQLIKYLGKRAGVQRARPHLFRHTFAINFLRNDGKTLELQRLLGHTTLEMVKRYVALAQVDIDKAHRRSSPVTNWRL